MGDLQLVQRLNELKDQDPNQQQQITPQQPQADSGHASRLHVRRFVSLVDGPDRLDGILEKRYDHRDSSRLISRDSETAH
jgi:hypothetical protein